MAAIKSTKVPKAFGETYAVITTITDTFCRERLNEEYGELARYRFGRSHQIQDSATLLR